MNQSSGRLAGNRDLGVEQHEQMHRHACSHHGGGEPGEGVRHDDGVAKPVDRLHDDLCVGAQSGGVVVAWRPARQSVAAIGDLPDELRGACEAVPKSSRPACTSTYVGATGKARSRPRSPRCRVLTKHASDVVRVVGGRLSEVVPAHRFIGRRDGPRGSSGVSGRSGWTRSRRRGRGQQGR
jgi:hypothetical protein